MKKTGLLATACLLAATVAGAQGFYLRLGMGYAAPAASQTTYETPLPFNGFTSAFSGTRNNTSTTEAYNVKKASFSAGLQGTLAIGYMFSDHVGIQLDAIIGLSPQKFTFTDNNVNLNGVQSTIVTEQSARSLALLTPSLVLHTGTQKPLDLYARLGLVLPLNTQVTQDISITNLPGAGMIVTDDFNWNIKNSFSLGFAAAAGVNYRINDRMSVFGEISMLSMSAFAKEQKLNAITENGQSVSTTAFSPQTIQFSKSAVRDSNFTSQPTYAQPFSNVAFSVGVHYNLSSGHSKVSSHGTGEADRPRGGRFN